MQMDSVALTRRPVTLGGNQDTSWLKLMALVFMMIDHMDVALFGNMPELRMIGRIAMPLYVWCLVVGVEYTRDIYRYAFRLFILAVVSQPVNMVALGNPWSKLNILFLLLLGVLSIAGIQKKRYGSQFWVPAACFLLLGFLKVDYGWKGLAFILLMYFARRSAGGLAAMFLAYAMYWGSSGSQITTVMGMPLTFLTWPGIGPMLQPFFHMQAMMWMALPLILIPTRMNVRLPKWLGYGFYPLHLLVIIVIRLLAGDSPAELFGVLGTL